MDENLFAKLIESASQAADIVRERIADTGARLNAAAEDEALC